MTRKRHGKNLFALAPACAAAEGPRAERLRADVEWLAHDEREGRRAGTPGEEQTVEWIAARLAELGCEPAGEQGFFQSFEVF